MMKTITKQQFERLQIIQIQCKLLWAQIARLEDEAYMITGEEDKQGFTSDLILQSDMTPEWLLKTLKIQIEK